jgi:hypothetical protein
MLGTTRIALSAAVALSIAFALSAAFPASAATKHHRAAYGVTHDRRTIYNSVVPSAESGGCPPSGGPSCSSAGPAPPDGW